MHQEHCEMSALLEGFLCSSRERVISQNLSSWEKVTLLLEVDLASVANS